MWCIGCLGLSAIIERYSEKRRTMKEVAVVVFGIGIMAKGTPVGCRPK